MALTFPFSAIVGQDEMKLAILIAAVDSSTATLLAVDPAGLGGVVLCARAGPARDQWLAPSRAPAVTTVGTTFRNLGLSSSAKCTISYRGSNNWQSPLLSKWQLRENRLCLKIRQVDF